MSNSDHTVGLHPAVFLVKRWSRYQIIVQMEIPDVITAGAGLTFVVYPEAVAAMEACPQLFSFLFFFMLVLLATSSVCGSWEVLVGSINDQWPSLASKRYLTMPFTCAIGFLAGVPMCFDTGFLLFQVLYKQLE